MGKGKREYLTRHYLQQLADSPIPTAFTSGYGEVDRIGMARYRRTE